MIKNRWRTDGKTVFWIKRKETNIYYFAYNILLVMSRLNLFARWIFELGSILYPCRFHSVLSTCTWIYWRNKFYFSFAQLCPILCTRLLKYNIWTTVTQPDLREVSFQKGKATNFRPILAFSCDNMCQCAIRILIHWFNWFLFYQRITYVSFYTSCICRQLHYLLFVYVLISL